MHWCTLRVYYTIMCAYAGDAGDVENVMAPRIWCMTYNMRSTDVEGLKVLIELEPVF